ncbi:transglycosylase domain-containing protein [Kocuria palustris]|uniref:transglycosylase domain-containing protein n=1 Tax=Kocuria palustris TaxID=71999 RepID=UPI0011A7CEAB|nr:transglycosylase domain-containing protein [Kocuria palustris]
MASSPSSPDAREGTSAVGRVLAFLIASILAGAVVAGLIFPSAAAAGIAASGSVAWMKDLPEDLSNGPISRSSTAYARDGETELATFYAENRTPLSLDQISPHMQDAIVAVEDRDFYTHGGVSVTGILRAMANNATNSEGRQGASTLTQQYVNNLIIDRDVRAGDEASTLGANKGYVDKLQEMKLAVSMENELSKDEILQGYLNMVLFGPRNYGVETAANYYWGIPASELNLQQSATLAGLVQSPEYYNPATNPEQSIDRRNTVLWTMLDEGMITQAEYDEATAAPLDLDLHPENQGCTASEDAPYFCTYVENEILTSPEFGETPDERLNNLQRGGLRIVTTLDPKAQRVAQDEVENTQPADDNPDSIGSSLVSIEPDSGEIVAMAQNSNYSAAEEENQQNTVYNFNTDTLDAGTGGYQVGSTFKPAVLLAWIDAGKSVGQTIDASRTSYPADHAWEASCVDGGSVFEPGDDGSGFSFQNASRGYERDMSVEFGLYNSINSAIYAMADELDLCRIGELTADLGLHNGQTGLPIDTTHLSSLLGGSSDNISPLTMATAYATFANDGVRCEPRALRSVKGHDGTEYAVPESSCEREISENEARTVNHVLEQVLVRGSGHELGIGLENASAAKTGTTDNSTQTWLLGYTQGLSTASWVGSYAEGSRSLNDVSIGGDRPASQTSDPDDWVDGSSYAGEQWQAFMEEIAPDYNTDEFPSAPDNLIEGSRSADRSAPSTPSTESGGGASTPTA